MISTSSSVVRTSVQTATPLALMVGAYLLFAGHNNPGGGFAAGLVFGAVIALRTMANLSRPSSAIGWLVGGMMVVAATAAQPLLTGDAFLDQGVFSLDLPLLGTVKSGSALPFDIGVTAIVLGVVMAVLDGFDAADLAPERAQP